MKKKIIIGSIGAAVLIVLASFSSVLGGQSNDDTEKQSSPLFAIRTQRAIGTQNTDLLKTSYPGKEKISLKFLMKSKEMKEQLYEAIDGIYGMSNKSFNQFVNNVDKKLCEQKDITEEDILSLLDLFRIAREKPDAVKLLASNEMKNNSLKNMHTVTCYTIYFGNCPLYDLLVMILILTFPIWYPIYLLYKIIKENKKLPTYRFCP